MTQPGHEPGLHTSSISLTDLAPAGETALGPEALAAIRALPAGAALLVAHAGPDAGAHTCSRRLRTASTTTSATASGVVDRGAGFRPSVIRVRTKPGRTTVTPTSWGRSASVSPV